MTQKQFPISAAFNYFTRIKQVLFLTLLIALLSSCRTYQNFNHQKFTKLKAISSSGQEAANQLPNTEKLLENTEKEEVEIIATDADSIKLKDGSVIVADVFSVKMDFKLDTEKVIYKTEEPGKKEVLPISEVDTIIYDNKIQVIGHELTIDPELTDEAKARQNHRLYRIYLILGIVMIPFFIALWAGGFVMYLFFWAIGAFFAGLINGSSQKLGDDPLILITFLYAIGIGVFMSLLFLFISYFFKRRPGVISREKR